MSKSQPYLGALAVIYTSTVFAKKVAAKCCHCVSPVRLRDPFLEKGRCSVEQDVGLGTDNRPSIRRRYSSFTGASRPRTHPGTVSLPVRHLLIRRNWTRMAIGCLLCCGFIESLSLIDGIHQWLFWNSIPQSLNDSFQNDEHPTHTDFHNDTTGMRAQWHCSFARATASQRLVLIARKDSYLHRFHWRHRQRTMSHSRRSWL